MGTITGLTADRTLEIEAESIVDGNVDGSGHLILIKHDGSEIDAGSVIGPIGPVGAAGSAASSSRLNVETDEIGIALHLGVIYGGMADALNITPYGAAAVVFASGADYDGAGVSTAHAASATQIEFLNSGINIFANTGLTAGSSYTRTKRMKIDENGLSFPSTIGRKISLSESDQYEINLGANAMEFRKPSYGPSSFVWKRDTTPIMSLDNSGILQAIGVAGYFGGGAMGADMSAVAVGQYDPDYATISAYQPVRAQCHLIIQSKGSGQILLRNGLDPSLNFIIAANGQIQTNQVVGNYQVSVGGAGGAAALPATPVGYLVVNMNGVDRKIPYYNY